MPQGSRVLVIERGDCDWWAECLICNQWVSTSNETKRAAEQKFGRHLQNDHALHIAADQQGADGATLRELLNRWDPIGVYDPITDFPGDEYDCLYSPLLSRLQRGDRAEEISILLSNELEQHFGLDPRLSRTKEFADELVSWFARGA